MYLFSTYQLKRINQVTIIFYFFIFLQSRIQHNIIHDLNPMDGVVHSHVYEFGGMNPTSIELHSFSALFCVLVSLHYVFYFAQSSNKHCTNNSQIHKT